MQAVNHIKDKNDFKKKKSSQLERSQLSLIWLTVGACGKKRFLVRGGIKKRISFLPIKQLSDKQSQSDVWIARIDQIKEEGLQSLFRNHILSI